MKTGTAWCVFSLYVKFAIHSSIVVLRVVAFAVQDSMALVQEELV